MTTIHDEEKIEDIIELAAEYGNWRCRPEGVAVKKQLTKSIKKYAKAISQKTIDGCLFYVDKYRELAFYANNDKKVSGYEIAFDGIEEDIKRLK